MGYMIKQIRKLQEEKKKGRDRELPQEGERFARHRAGEDVAADHDPLDPGGADLREHRLEGGEIAVNVIERGDAHR